MQALAAENFSLTVDGKEISGVFAGVDVAGDEDSTAWQTLTIDSTGELAVGGVVTVTGKVTVSDGVNGLLPAIEDWCCVVCGQDRSNDGTPCRFCGNTEAKVREPSQNFLPLLPPALQNSNWYGDALEAPAEKKTREKKQLPVTERERLKRKVDF